MRVGFNVRFWGKSFELIPAGTVHVTLKATGEHYTWNKVTTCMRSVFSQSRYLEHYGTMNIKNETTGHTTTLIFKESGYFSSAKNEVVGNLFSPKGKKVCSIQGSWESVLTWYKDESVCLRI
jgi:hypothetical protein